MSRSNSSSPDLSPLERELHGFIVEELVTDDAAASIGAEDDLIKSGIVDSLGVMQLVDYCESQYGIRIGEVDLVPDNFRTVRQLADFVDRKQAR
jgi:acyl carrier protein